MVLKRDREALTNISDIDLSASATTSVEVHGTATVVVGSHGTAVTASGA